jgi:hypothetical protein
VRWLASHPLTAIPDQPAPPTGGWLFDEGQGRRAVGRFGPDGTLSSGVAWSTDTPRGGAGDHSVWFDGPLSNDNRVTIPGLSFGTEGSLQVWAYKERNVATTRYVFDSSGPRYLLYGSGVGTWDLYMNSQRLGAIPAELIPLEEWTHLIITWDESLTDGMRQKIYRNGRLFHHFNATPGAGFPAEFYLGNRFSLNEPWWGGLDELAFWSYALPPDQVAWLYDNSIAPLPEPTTLSLLALGGTAALLRRRRRRTRAAR